MEASLHIVRPSGDPPSDQEIARCEALLAVGWTYVIQAGDDGPVKVGSTRGEPRDRLRQLQTGCPDDLTLRFVFPGVMWEEWLHEEFQVYRLRGEWFAPYVLRALALRHDADEAAERAVGRPLDGPLLRLHWPAT